ncbi:transcription factor Adf-1-like [Amphibalanus amphitrite]|uniref:transcription factor Adf-1-like n=1 Tax=Amphibalanus amphitrite TaxID=1232801 RepID=UPI001C9152DE|nr:transcription factor Adf-1-like [Amphibalanus amphitrite]
MAVDKELLIHTVAKYPWLYDKSHRSYKDNIKKTNSWHEISKNLKITEDEAKKVWTDLRNSYRKIHARVKAGAPSGSGATDAAKHQGSRWWLYESMDAVLSQHIQPSRQGGDSIMVAAKKDAPRSALDVDSSQSTEFNYSANGQLLVEEAGPSLQAQAHAGNHDSHEPSLQSPHEDDSQLSELQLERDHSPPSPPLPPSAEMPQSLPAAAGRNCNQSPSPSAAARGRPPAAADSRTPTGPRGTKRARQASQEEWQETLVSYLRTKEARRDKTDIFDALGKIVADRTRRMSQWKANLAQVKVIETLNMIDDM